MKQLALALVSFLFASPALANPATSEGADHLTQVFQSYFGQHADVFSVVAHGDFYDLTVDVRPLFSYGQDAGVTGSLSRVAMQLVDNSDGTWGVSLDQPISIDLSIPEVFDLSQEVASVSFTGTFDDVLLTFTEAKATFSGMKIVETIYLPDAPPQIIEVVLDTGSMKSTGQAAVGGGSDSHTTLFVSGITQTVITPAMNGDRAMPITIKAESLSQTVTGTRFMRAEILQLASWIASHPDQAAKDADRAGLKAILTAAMPFFGNLQGSGTVSMLSVDTPMGALGVEEVGFAIDMNGALADGKFREAFTFAGLTLPAGLVPDWAEPLVPQSMSLDVQVTDFDPAAAVTAALSTLDSPAVSATGPEFDAKLLAALLPKGTVTVRLNPGVLTGADYELTYEGAMVMGPDMEVPTGTATVTLTGADALAAVLGNVPDDMKAEAMMGFGVAQGMAKAEGDKLVWQIDATSPGALSINGMAMMGGN